MPYHAEISGYNATKSQATLKFLGVEMAMRMRFILEYLGQTTAEKQHCSAYMLSTHAMARCCAAQDCMLN